MLNEPCDVGGSVPEPGAVKPRCYSASCLLNSSLELHHWWEMLSAELSTGAGGVILGTAVSCWKRALDSACS